MQCSTDMELGADMEGHTPGRCTHAHASRCHAAEPPRSAKDAPMDATRFRRCAASTACACACPCASARAASLSASARVAACASECACACACGTQGVKNVNGMIQL